MINLIGWVAFILRSMAAIVLSAVVISLTLGAMLFLSALLAEDSSSAVHAKTQFFISSMRGEAFAGALLLCTIMAIFVEWPKAIWFIKKLSNDVKTFTIITVISIIAAFLLIAVSGGRLDMGQAGLLPFFQTLVINLIAASASGVGSAMIWWIFVVQPAVRRRRATRSKVFQ